MKKLISFFAILFFINEVHAQVPQSIPYQAVVRDNSGAVIPNQIVSFRFTIHEFTAGGPPVYSEKQFVTTNSLGLGTASIGTGTIVSGTFSSINWAVGNKFLQVEIDVNGGSTYTDMGTTQLASVPFALYAGTSGGTASGDLSGTYPSPTVLKINGSPLGATTGATNGQVLKFSGGVWAPGTDNTGSGVTSVGLSMPSGFSVSGSPVTTSGNLSVSTTLNGPLRGTGSGITTGNINLSTETTGTLPVTKGGTNSSNPLTGFGIMVSNGTSIILGQAGTSSTVLHGNASGFPVYNPVNLATEVSGQLQYVNLPLLSGDVSGLYGNNSVDRIRNVSVSTNPPANGQVLTFNSGLNWWEASTPTTGWGLLGNTGTDPANNFIGTTDGANFRIKVNNQKAGLIEYTFGGNTFFGYQSGNASASVSTISNTAVGYKTMFTNTNGDQNTAMGEGTLYFLGSGGQNTAIGYYAQYNAHPSSINYNQNTSIGYYAMYGSSTPTDNVGHFNLAAGSYALYSNSSGNGNSALGASSLYSNSTGEYNTGIGNSAALSNSTGNYNTAIGNGALANNTTGSYNVSIGNSSLQTTSASSYNTAVGNAAGTGANMGDYNTYIGYFTQANSGGYINSTALGSQATITSSNQVRIGDFDVLSIGGYQNWSNLSDGRFKKNIKENVPGLAFIMQLRPVTYTVDLQSLSAYLKRDNNTNEDKQVHSGFVAQEVEESAKELDYDFSGVDAPKNENDLYGLRYAEFVVPMVKAMQEQQAMIVALQKEVEDLKKQLAK